ncbi:MAG: 50S ribosomal protein L30 [Deltaproteobacteria bacterium]|nr:50S ribosomal protein L30 [Deltaproteobacteria bacterium]
MATGKTGKIKVTLIKSPIGFHRIQREHLKGLGLRKLHSTKELNDNATVRGLIAKVPHLLKVEG